MEQTASGIDLTTPALEGRGCGERDEGEPYACCGTSRDGWPMEYFVVDPVIPWPTGFQRGAEVLPRRAEDGDGIHDLVIYVGAENYPIAWDFVEEARRFGASRKLSDELEFEKLTPGPGGSRMVFVHRFAQPKFDYLLLRNRPLYGCKQAHVQDWSGFETWVWSDDEQRFTMEGRTPGYGWHPDGTRCTHALRDLAWLFHRGAEFQPRQIPGEPPGYRVKFASTEYGGRFPYRPHPCSLYQGCLGADFKEVKCPLCPALPARQGKLLQDDTQWTTGAFLALPLTHFEGKGKMKDPVKERIQKTGFEVVDGLDW